MQMAFDDVVVLYLIEIWNTMTRKLLWLYCNVEMLMLFIGIIIPNHPCIFFMRAVVCPEHVEVLMHLVDSIEFIYYKAIEVPTSSVKDWFSQFGMVLPRCSCSFRAIEVRSQLI